MRLDPRTLDRLIHAARRFERIEQRFVEFSDARDWFKCPQCLLGPVTVEQGEDLRCVIASFGTTTVARWSIEGSIHTGTRSPPAQVFSFDLQDQGFREARPDWHGQRAAARVTRMCTRYITPEQAAIERFWHIGARNQPRWWAHDMFPAYAGPFLRAARDTVAPGRELVVGQWALIPWFAKERKLKYPTCNARSEELAQKASYKHPWARGQRCVIPAAAFFEPCWETGRHVPWRFTRADGEPWSLAGLWSTWTDPATGELVESYTMLTLNADAHPLMARMHKPDPKRPAHLQDKRSVVPIEPEDVDTWLHAPLEQAAQLVRLASAELFVAEPAPT